ncbi:MAG: gliding motility-associated C-terminal domain-containing protein [Chitinophagaceae bacterium]|nr:gliding motility-associated C-terminal domain-containing protein [Chitinophagaceae bacterium]
MKRLRLLFILLVLLGASFQGYSQLILGPDSLCIENELKLTTPVTSASSYYWGFCSAYLNNIPTGSSIGAGTGLDAPSSIAMGKDGSNYFVFAANTNAPRDLIRYEFGTNLSNAPVATNLGSFAGGIPVNCKGFELVNTGGNWYGFIAGGATAANSDLIRLDFGNSLSNTPTLVDIGNLGGLLLNPQDLFVFSEAGNWYAFTANGFTGNLIRLDFGASITNVPALVNLGNPGTLAFPTGFWPVQDGSNWHLFVVNRLSQTLSRLDFGTSLLNPAVETNLGGFAGAFNGPRDISIIRDCGNFYGYVTNENDNTMVMLTFAGNITSVPVASNLGNFAGFDGPRYLTRFIRDKDNVFSFTANNVSNSISRLEYNSCTISSIPSSTLQTPPVVQYTTPGTYNVYFVADEGLPTMKVDCKLITVLPKPFIEINNDTLICQRDTILLVANGPGLWSTMWDPMYHGISPFDTTSIRVYPYEDYRYHVHLEFNSVGTCGFDTSVLVKVSRVTADAGPDRFVADGAYTELGGPRQSTGQEYSYAWTPALYLNSPVSAFPVCTPLDVQAYYLQVTNDSSGCVAFDSVWVRTECTDISLPNAFNPASDIAINRNFGLMNSAVVKLEFFKIFNRWGQLIFETTDPMKKWDGTQNNIKLPPDNYVWIIDGYCNNGKRIKKQGTVLLVR